MGFHRQRYCQFDLKRTENVGHREGRLWDLLDAVRRGHRAIWLEISTGVDNRLTLEEAQGRVSGTLLFVQLFCNSKSIAKQRWFFLKDSEDRPQTGRKYVKDLYPAFVKNSIIKDKKSE